MARFSLFAVMALTMAAALLDFRGDEDTIELFTADEAQKAAISDHFRFSPSRWDQGLNGLGV